MHNLSRVQEAALFGASENANVLTLDFGHVRLDLQISPPLLVCAARREVWPCESFADALDLACEIAAIV